MTNDLLDGIRRNEHRKICMRFLRQLRQFLPKESQESQLSHAIFL